MRVFVLALLATATLLHVALSAPTGDYQDLYPYEGLEDEQEEEQQLQQDEEEEEEEQQQQQQGWGAATLPQDLAYLQLFGDPQGSQLEEALSRAGAIRLPSGNRRKGGMPPPFADSPVYYIRMPPSPYVFVPGVGYVSQPPPPPPPPPRYSPFINLPLDFVANGKPTHVYRWPKPGNRPKPPTQQQQKPVVHHLDKGPYVFNGKPGDKVQVLREQYNALYADALQNLYP